MKSYEDMADAVDDLKDSGREMEGLTPVKAKVSKNPSAVLSFRLPASELDAITKAAKQKGLTVSNFVRLAALGAAQGVIDLDEAKRNLTIQEIRAKAFDLAETARGL